MLEVNVSKLSTNALKMYIKCDTIHIIDIGGVVLWQKRILCI